MNAMIRGALALGLALSLAACGGGDGDDDGGAGTQTGAAAPQDNFGAGFKAAFNSGTAAEDGLPGGVAGAVDTTRDPVDPRASDLIALSLTTDPVAIP